MIGFIISIIFCHVFTAHRKYKELDPECHFALCLPDYCHVHSPVTTPHVLPLATSVVLPLTTPVVPSPIGTPTFSVEIKVGYIIMKHLD